MPNMVRQPRRGPRPQTGILQTTAAPQGLPPPKPLIRKRANLAIALRGPLLAGHSIGHVMRNLGVALYRLGVDVRWDNPENQRAQDAEFPTYWAQVEPFIAPLDVPHVTVAWDPQVFRGGPQERGRVHLDPTDSFRCWNEQCIANYAGDMVDFLFCFSPECQATWVKHGVAGDKVEVLPLGVDTAIFRPDGPRWQEPPLDWLTEARADDGAFTFLVAGYLQHRKGGMETVEAFCREFAGRTDVRLILKNVHAAWGNDQRAALRSLLAKFPDAPPVAYCGERVSDYEMAAILRSVDCLVNAHRMEGFGLVPLQAMASGTPVVVTNFHGPRQYATADNAYLVPITRVAPANTAGVPAKMQWAQYDLGALQQALARAAAGENREQIIANGLRTAGQWGWGRAAEKVVAEVEQRLGSVARRPRKWRHPKIDCTVVMPVRNGSAKLATTLETMYAKWDCPETLVYDDGSDVEECLAIKDICAQFPRVRLLRGNGQLGCHGARQVLFEEARGEFIASLDADMDFSQTPGDWARRLIDLWEKRGGGIMHALLVWPYRKGETPTVQSAGGLIPPEGKIPCKHRLEMLPVTDPRVRRAAEVVYGCGAMQFFHQEMLETVSQDPAYWPAFFGDVDLCYRARLAGFPVWYCPEVQIIHDANSWTKAGRNQNETRWQDNAARFAQRYGDLCAQDKERQDETGAIGYEAAPTTSGQRDWQPWTRGRAPEAKP